ncbi:MAG TPA: PilZ domain-containing protein [Thermoanaerobaculia bacterium]|nr:PilZ domain-containing protein [Thermoanaerobaculia bacterium]
MNEERRKARRLPVEMRIELESGSGLTRDVSGLGVLFTSESRLDLEDEIDFTLRVPVGASVKCRGRVVRVIEETPLRFAIGATIDRCLLPEESTGDPSSPSEVFLKEMRQHHPEAWEWGE